MVETINAITALRTFKQNLPVFVQLTIEINWEKQQTKKMQQQLFTTGLPGANLLPYDGEVLYFQNAIAEVQPGNFFNRIINEIAWQQDELMMFGKRIITKRKVAWYGEQNFAYTYSHITRNALPFSAILLQVKTLTELLTGDVYNACLLNLYHNGNEGMGWHSDDENTIVENSAIASVSFGAERKFAFRHKKTKETMSLVLNAGSVLVMRGATQTCWHHALPKSSKILQPRINLTFRKMKT